MRRLLRWFQRRRAAASRDRAAITRALACFQAGRKIAPMGAHIVRREADHLVVRVMYFTNHIPPDRAWYAVPDEDVAIRELSFADAGDTAPWR